MCRNCNLTSFSPCLTGPVDYSFASHHKGPGFKTPEGGLSESGIPLLALSHNIGDPDVIDQPNDGLWALHGVVLPYHGPLKSEMGLVPNCHYALMLTMW